jgi:hypothetical protein
MGVAVAVGGIGVLVGRVAVGCDSGIGLGGRTSWLKAAVDWTIGVQVGGTAAGSSDVVSNSPIAAVATKVGRAGEVCGRQATVSIKNSKNNVGQNLYTTGLSPVNLTFLFHQLWGLHSLGLPNLQRFSVTIQYSDWYPFIPVVHGS